MINKNTIELLQKEQKILHKLIQDTEKKLARAPEGSVQVKRHGKGWQYFHRKNPQDKNGTYIPVADKGLAMALIQKKYLRDLLQAAHKQEDSIRRFLKEFDSKALINAYHKQGSARETLIKPIEVPDVVFTEEWQMTEYQAKPFREDVPMHMTLKGERVRSKSEVIIANTLKNLKIPYHYECPVTIRGKLIHPDFTVLRIADRKEIFWEHLGMIDDFEYRNQALQRIQDYEAEGIFIGDRLIITAETYRKPLTAEIVERAVHHYLK